MEEFTLLCIFTSNSGAPWPYTFTHDPDALTAPVFFIHTFISLTGDLKADLNAALFFPRKHPFPQLTFGSERSTVISGQKTFREDKYYRYNFNGLL